MHGIRLDDRLYRIAFFVLDSQSDSKISIVLNMRVNYTTPAYALRLSLTIWPRQKG